LQKLAPTASDEHRAARTELHELSHRAVWDTDLGPLLLGVRIIASILAPAADQEHEINLQKRTEKKTSDFKRDPVLDHDRHLQEVA
jgi:hypothetical protein